MSVISINIDNETASISESTTENITSGDRGITDIEFFFSPEWEKYKKTVLIYKGLYDPKDAVWILMNGDKLSGTDIPSKLMRTPGFLNIGIFGDDDDGRRITTNIVTKRIDDGTPADDTESEVDYSLYNQIIRQLIILERTTEEFDQKFEKCIAELDKKFSESISDINSIYTDSIEKMTEKHTDCVKKMDEKYEDIITGVQNRYDTVVSDIEQFKNDKINEITIQVSGHIQNINNVVNNNINNINSIVNTSIQNINREVDGHLAALNRTVSEGSENISKNVNDHMNNIAVAVGGHITNITDTVDKGIIQIEKAKDDAVEEFNSHSSDYYTKAEVDALIESIKERG